jgi:cyclophilin family peptidyl-prolyl cis-trans isomerase
VPRLQSLIISICLSTLPGLGLAVAIVQPDPSDQAADEFAQLEAEFRRQVIEVQQICIRYFHSPTLESAEALREEYDDQVAAGNLILEKWSKSGTAEFEKNIAEEKQISLTLLHFMVKVVEREFRNGQYLAAYNLAKKINNIRREIIPVQRFLVRAGLLTNHFDSHLDALIKSDLEYYQKNEEISSTETSLMANLFTLERMFQHETAIRDAEQQANDLPRIEFLTSKGAIVVELFENEAPDTVGNFISLVESGHYNGMIFHAVGDKLVAETGLLDEARQPRLIGYTIYDEARTEKARRAFAGSLVMATEKANTGNSRFYFARAPLINLNLPQTVFGRVISGMETVYLLNNTFRFEGDKQIEIEDAIPDKIISAKVLRKRDHEYVPRKVQSG